MGSGSYEDEGLPPNLATGWSLHPLDTGALLAFHARRKLIWLNGTAAWSFLRLAAGADRATCGARLSARLGLAQADARCAVEDTLAMIEAALASPEGQFALTLDRPTKTPSRQRAAGTACYAIAGRRVRISCVDTDDHARVSAALAHIAVHGTGPAPACDHDIHVPARAGWILVDRAEGLPRIGSADLLPQLARVLFALWYRGCSDFIAVHAGLVRLKGRGILLPGSSGFGKTTAVAALLHLGATYHGDDFVMLDPSGRARAFPFPLTVKAANIANLAALFPDLARADVSERIDGTRVAYLVPSAGAEVDTPIDCLVFPRFRAGRHAAVQSVAPSAALIELAREWCVVGTSEPTRLDAFVGWLQEVPAFELTYPDPVAALDGFATILEQLA